MKRRELLVGGLALVGAGGGGSRAAAQARPDGKPRNENSPFKLGVAAYSYRKYLQGAGKSITLVDFIMRSGCAGRIARATNCGCKSAAVPRATACAARSAAARQDKRRAIVESVIPPQPSRAAHGTSAAPARSLPSQGGTTSRRRQAYRPGPSTRC